MAVLLDVSSLSKAIDQLESGLEFCNDVSIQKDAKLLIHVRAGTIQAFEFTYELAWKMLKRYLELSEPNASEIDQMSFPDLIRLGCERGLLLSDVSVWKTYRQERGTTSFTFDQGKVLETLAMLPEFLAEAKFLLNSLQLRVKLDLNNSTTTLPK